VVTEPCGEICGGDFSTGYEVRLDWRMEYAMGSQDLLRAVQTGRHLYCPACARSAPAPRKDSIIVATKEQAEFLTPIYERFGLGPVAEFDEVPPKGR